MKATIDAAGRLVIPKALRERLGLQHGEVEIEADGADLRVRAVGRAVLIDDDGWLVVPSGGAIVTDDDVQTLDVEGPLRPVMSRREPPIGPDRRGVQSVPSPPCCGT